MSYVVWVLLTIYSENINFDLIMYYIKEALYVLYDIFFIYSA